MRTVHSFLIGLVAVIAGQTALSAGLDPCGSSNVIQGWQTSAIVSHATAELSWEAATGASTYDVYLGPSEPPPLWQTGIEGTSLAVDGLADGTTYYWYVVAHAECDPTLTSRSAIQSFNTTGSCSNVGAFQLVSPSQGEAEISTLAVLTWNAAPAAASYDIYLGRSNPPAIALRGVTGISAEIPQLLPSTTYYWRVVARSACNSSVSESEVRSFQVTSQCLAPRPTSITFAPSEVEAGQTYAISWEESEGLDPGASYTIERSRSSDFSTILDRQQTTATSTSFIVEGSGELFHRVRSVAGCSSSRVSDWSRAESVKIVKTKANVVFTRTPEPVITNLGDALEDERRNFTIENIGPDPVQVIVSRREVDSVPFFQIYDPLGESTAFLTLKPREPRTLELRFSGPPNDVAASYQGIIAVTVIGQPVSVSPYAWINLRVGGGESATPVFLVDGLESEYVAFPPKAGDDSDRPAISVDILNDGDQPMTLAGEIGPEMWLFPDSEWNENPIPAKSFKPVRLSTLRFLAPNNSALPRYTYFTVQTQDGKSARLLVQDNTAFETGQGRPSLADPEARSFVIPTVTSESLAGGVLRTSRIRLTNLGSASAQTELLYTPTGEDGLGPNVRRATVVLPPNDVVNLTDPLVQVLGLTRPANGQLEIRAAPEKIGLITANASIETRLGGGSTMLEGVPTLLRGEGASVGSPHVVAGLIRDQNLSTDLVLTETTGKDGATASIILRAPSGSVLGATDIEVMPYGRVVIGDVINALGGEIAGSGFRVDIAIASGGGSIAGVASLKTTDGQSTSSIISRVSGGAPVASKLGRSLQARTRKTEPAGGEDGSRRRIVVNSLRVLDGERDVYLVPTVISGPFGSLETTRTELLLTNVGEEEEMFSLTFTDDQSGNVGQASRTVGPDGTLSIPNAVELFGYAETQSVRGSLMIESGEGGRVFAQTWASAASRLLFDSVPTVSADSESMTGAGSMKPLVADGLEQSVDEAFGSRSTLILTELAGQSTSVLVRLYEAGNRTSPIAEKVVTVPAASQVWLETLFRALDLDTDQRRKDRTNVQVVIVPTSGSGLVSAVLQTIDNRTGDLTFVELQPAGGSPATGIQKAGVRSTSMGRGRPVRRP